MSDRACRVCGQTKSADAMVRRLGAVSSLCRACNVARVAEWRQANPDKARAARARHRDTHREARRASQLDRYHRLMAEDPERVRRQRREWAKTPKGRMLNRFGAHKRRGVRPDDEAREWAAIVLSDPCSYCGAPADELDHITPVAVGGDGGWSNLTGACRVCNARKNDADLLSFLARSREGAVPASTAPSRVLTRSL